MLPSDTFMAHDVERDASFEVVVRLVGRCKGPEVIEHDIKGVLDEVWLLVLLEGPPVDFSCSCESTYILFCCSDQAPQSFI